MWKCENKSTRSSRKIHLSEQILKCGADTKMRIHIHNCNALFDQSKFLITSIVNRLFLYIQTIKAVKGTKERVWSSVIQKNSCYNLSLQSHCTSHNEVLMKWEQINSHVLNYALQWSKNVICFKLPTSK